MWRHRTGACQTTSSFFNALPAEEMFSGPSASKATVALAAATSRAAKTHETTARPTVATADLRQAPVKEQV